MLMKRFASLLMALLFATAMAAPVAVADWWENDTAFENEYYQGGYDDNLYEDDWYYDYYDYNDPLTSNYTDQGVAGGTIERDDWDYNNQALDYNTPLGEAEYEYEDGEYEYDYDMFEWNGDEDYDEYGDDDWWDIF